MNKAHPTSSISTLASTSANFMFTNATFPSATTPPSNESTLVLKYSLPTEAWVGISVAIVVILIIIISIVVVVIKKRQVSKNFTNQKVKQANQQRVNDAVERNIYSTPEDSSKDPHTYENFGPASIYQEVASTTDTKMTSNSIYNDFEPSVSENTPEKSVAARNRFDELEQSTFKMSVNALYGDGYQSKQQGFDSQDSHDGSCIYATPNKGKKSALTDDDQTDDIYNFAENVSAREMVNNDIYKS